MIIQCPKCLTKFKLDDSKVKDEGIKVRCAKCKEVFVVTKEETPHLPTPVQPEMPVEKEEFDFSFGDSTGEKKEEPFDQFGGGFGEVPPAIETAGKVPDFSFGDMPAEETKEEEVKKATPDFSGMAFGEVSFSEPEEAKPKPVGAPEGFEYKSEEPSFGDINFNEEEPHAEPLHEAPFGEFKETPAPALPAEEKAMPKEKLPPPAAFEPESAVPGFDEEGFHDELLIGKEKETRRSFLKTISVFVLICAIAAVPLWFLWTNYKGAETGQINLAELTGYYTQNAEAGNIFVVTGMAVNNTNKARSFFQVKGILFGKKGEKLVQKEVYCGNVFSSKELTTRPRSKIEADLINKVGSKLSNINLAPGKSVPFTIIFFDLPQEMGEFSVEVVGSQIAS